MALVAEVTSLRYTGVNIRWKATFPDTYHQITIYHRGKKEKREKYRSHITLFGRSRIWGFFCQEEIAGRRTDEAKSGEFYWKSGENKEEHLGWSPHKPLTG